MSARRIGVPACARALGIRRPAAFSLLLLPVLACARPSALPDPTGISRSAALDPYARAPAAQDETFAPPGDPAAYRAAPDAWRAPGLALPGPGVVNDLPGLIDVALAAHPTTRRAWEEARAAAARLGRSESPYYPKLAFVGEAAAEKTYAPSPQGTETFHQRAAGPGLTLTWILLDFGRRSADVERATQQLLASNFAFNRSLQDVVFDVQRSYYALDAREAAVRATEADLVAATTVAEAAQARLATGLSTKPDVLLALQLQAESAYRVEDARGRAESAKADLARAVGVSAELPLAIQSLQDQPLPPALTQEVEALIDEALRRRPDVAAQLAEVRAREAEVARARARFWPTVTLSGDTGRVFTDYSAGRRGLAYESHYTDRDLYGAYLTLEWSLFEGFDRVNAVREATSGVEASRARLAEAELDAIAEVWRAYADFKSALRKWDFAVALLESAQETYDAGLETYRVGLNTITNLLLAQRDLSRARAVRIETKAELLTSSAALAHAAGAMPVGALGP